MAKIKSKADCCDKQHPDYSKELPRLNRISGQIEGVKKMISERRYCPEILTQLRAARAAVNSIEASILETHLDSCVADAFDSGNQAEKKQKMNELKEMYRRFNE